MKMLMGIMLMQALPLWDMNHFKGEWNIQNDTRSQVCRVVLTDHLGGRQHKMGYDVLGDHKCLELIGIKGAARWGTMPGGIVITTETGKSVGSYRHDGKDTLKGGAPMPNRYTMKRVRN